MKSKKKDCKYYFRQIEDPKMRRQAMRYFSVLGQIGARRPYNIYEAISKCFFWFDTLERTLLCTRDFPLETPSTRIILESLRHYRYYPSNFTRDLLIAATCLSEGAKKTY